VELHFVRSVFKEKVKCSEVIMCYLLDSQCLPSYIAGHAQVYEWAGKSSAHIQLFLHLFFP